MRFVHYEQVESTNDVALAMARDGEPEWTVVRADTQTRGRGRPGRTWTDEPGSSLLMSVLCRRPPELSRLLTFAAAVAVVEALQSECGLSEVLLKWPNDVRRGGRKLAGILVETISTPDGPAAAVGIGLNVRQRQFPHDLASVATSVHLECGRCGDIERLGRAVALRFSQVAELPGKEILRLWRRYMEGSGRRIEVTGEGRILTGTLTDIDGTGALVIAGENGDPVTVHSADSLRFVDI